MSVRSSTDLLAVAIADRVAALLVEYTYRAARERELQDGIETVLRTSGYRVEREFRLSARDRPDFFIEGCVAIEVKMRANGSAVLSQLVRYASDRRVKALVVATPRLSTLTGIPLARFSVSPSAAPRCPAQG